jgi:hypothetical protein
MTEYERESWMYGAFLEHVINFFVEAAIQQFLLPGFKRCTSKITPGSLFHPGLDCTAL